MTRSCRYSWTVRRKMPTWSIFNSATLGGLKDLKRITTLMNIGSEKQTSHLCLLWRLFWFFRRKSIEPEFVQRYHPTFLILYILMITFLCHASLIDAFDPQFPIFNAYLYISKFEVSKKSRFQVLEFFRGNHLVIFIRKGCSWCNQLKSFRKPTS